MIDHHSSFYFTDKDVAIPEIGKILDVKYLVSGSFSRQGDDYLTMLIVDPIFKNLHSDPRWIPLLKRLKFPKALKR